MSKDTSKGGRNRDWGYASYDVDKFNDYSDSNLQYTSYEKSGSVNRYGDNGDGGHSHAHYNDSSSYNTGGNPSTNSPSFLSIFSGIKSGICTFTCPSSLNFLSNISFIFSQIAYPFGSITMHPFTHE